MPAAPEGLGHAPAASALPAGAGDSVMGKCMDDLQALGRGLPSAHAHVELATATLPCHDYHKQYTNQQAAQGNSWQQPHLQQAAPRIPWLNEVLLQELAGITQDSNVLVAVQYLLQQQQQNSSTCNNNITPRATTSAALPLLALELSHNVCKQQQDGVAPAAADAAAVSGALWTTVLGNHSSPFLQALKAELHRMSSHISSCYAEVEQQLISMGQLLPPAPDSSSSSDCSQEEQGASGAANPQCSPGSSYGADLDLAALQRQADSMSAALVQLDDFIHSSCSKLTQLAQKYDVEITAAAMQQQQQHGSLSSIAEGTAAAAATTATAAAPAEAERQGSKGGLLGVFRRRQQGARSGSTTADATSEGCAPLSHVAPATAPAPELLLLTPGVSSHSSQHSFMKYTAGIPPDAYHQAIHKLLAQPGAAEPLLWGLSVVYARLRHAEVTQAAAAAVADATAATGVDAGEAVAAAAAGATAWQAPDKFTRSTTKYWVHPSNILRLKLALLRQLPLLVYGATDPLFAADISSSAALRAGSQGITSLISSVYFDSPGLDVYHTRLARDDMARLVRFRYYGPRQLGAAGGSQHVFVERKTHRESWTGERSVKERASLLQHQVPAFLATGQLPAGELSKGKEQLLHQVHEYLTSWNQSAAVRTEYLRTAWQRYDSNSVRLSLDEHMLLLRERGQPVAQGDWCASLEDQVQLQGCDAVRFPYGILEIKLQEEAPAWVSELEASGVLVKARRFSKFLHGMSLLYPNSCSTSPSWFLWDEAARCAAPASLEEMREMSRERDMWKQQEQEQQVATAAAAASSGGPGPRAPHPTTASTAEVATLAAALAPLRIPRLSVTEATELPSFTAATTTASEGVLCSHGLAASCGSSSSSSRPDQGVLCGARLLTPRVHPSTNDTAVSRSSCDLSGFGTALHGSNSTLAGTAAAANIAAAGCTAFNPGSRCSGSGPFNAGINGGPSNMLFDRQNQHCVLHSDTNSTSSIASNHESSVCKVQQQPTASARPLPDGVAGSSGVGAAVQGFRVSCASDAALHVTNPLDHVLGYKANSLSSCSMSSLDTVTTGGGAGGMLHLHHAHPQQQHHLDRRSSTSCHSIPCNSSRTASAAASRQEGGAATLPPADAAAGGLHSRSDSDVVLNMNQLGGRASVSASGCRASDLALLQQQHLMQPQQQIIQVNYVMQDAEWSRPAAGVPAPLAGAAAAPAGPAGDLASVKTATVMDVHQAGTEADPQLVKLMQQLLPPVPVAAAAAGDLGGSKTNSAMQDKPSSKGRGQGVRLGPRGLLQQAKVAAAGRLGRFRARSAASASSSGAGGGRGWSLLSKDAAANNEHLLGFTGPRSESMPARVRTRAEPKTFFANERTFLAWLNLSVLVMMTGLGLLSSSSLMMSGSATGISCMDVMICSAARVSGAIISPVSILFMIYALYLFKKRTRQILTLSTMRYDDQNGPVLLTVLLVCVTVVAVVLAVLSWKALEHSAG